MQAGLYLLALMAAAVLFFWGVLAVLEGWVWVLPLAVWVVLPLSMAILRMSWEAPFRVTRDFITPSVMSSAIVIGGFVFLPFALFLAGMGWRDSHGAMAGSPEFFFGSLAFGYVVALCFAVLGNTRYIEAGIPTARFGPAKVWRDWAATPGLTALFTWVLLPQAGSENVLTTGAFVFVLLFGLLVVFGLRFPVVLWRRDPEWDVQKFCVPESAAFLRGPRMRS